MGQLLNRLRDFARTSLNTRLEHDWAERIIQDDDEELRRIIDELSQEEPQPRATHGATSEPPHNQQKHNLPNEVLRAHTLLNVPVGASVDVIKKAYRTAIATWHPDRFVQASSEDQAKAQHQARAINAAYLRLKDFYQIR